MKREPLEDARAIALMMLDIWHIHIMRLNISNHYKMVLVSVQTRQSNSVNVVNCVIALISELSHPLKNGIFSENLSQQ